MAETSRLRIYNKLPRSVEGKDMFKKIDVTKADWMFGDPKAEAKHSGWNQVDWGGGGWIFVWFYIEDLGFMYEE